MVGQVNDMPLHSMSQRCPVLWDILAVCLKRSSNIAQRGRGAPKIQLTNNFLKRKTDVSYIRKKSAREGKENGTKMGPIHTFTKGIVSHTSFHFLHFLLCYSFALL